MLRHSLRSFAKRCAPAPFSVPHTAVASVMPTAPARPYAAASLSRSSACTAKSTCTSFSTPTAVSAVPLAATAPARFFAAVPTDRRTVSREGNPNDVAFVMEDVTKRLGHTRTLFKGITTGFFHGAKVGVLGKNGAGKSSLLRIMAGVDKDFDGRAEATPGKVVGYLAQEPVLDESKTVIENILDGVGERKTLLDRYDAVGEAMGEPDADIDALIEEQSALQTRIDELDCWDIMRHVEIATAALCCPPNDAPVTSLSGGERRRVALARLLLSRPDILLLDEPTNHLDAGSVQWLEKYLDVYPGLVVAITHDRYFLDNVAGYILEIENGRFFPFRGNYEKWVDAKAKRLENDAAAAKNVDKQLAIELAWMQKRANGRQAKGKARAKKLEELQAEKEQYRRSRVESGTLVIPAGPHLGQSVVSLSQFGIAFDDSKGPGGVFTAAEIDAKGGPGSVAWTFRDVSINISPGQVVGIVGPNGIGKTTILKAIQGLIEPSAGSVHVGQSVMFGYNAQTREGLRPEATVWEEITQGATSVQIDSSTKINARQYVAQFNFSGNDQSKLIKQLSGGERNRVHLAKSLIKGANVIMLDEPTNDLDVDTLRSLEEALNAFEGCSFIVSHDRWFLDRVCTDILAFHELPDAKGEVRMTARLFPGNYTEFERLFAEEHGKSYIEFTNKIKNHKNITNL